MTIALRLSTPPTVPPGACITVNGLGQEVAGSTRRASSGSAVGWLAVASGVGRKCRPTD